MTPEELKALQAPIKDRFRESPSEACATLTATGRIDRDAIACTLRQQAAPAGVTGLHPMTGGDGSLACAAEMLLQSLVGCAGVTFAAVCTAFGITLDAAELTAKGDIDFRGTLGVSRDVPIGLTDVRLEFRLVSPASDEQLAKAVQLAERYCVVAQTLKSVSVTWHRE